MKASLVHHITSPNGKVWNLKNPPTKESNNMTKFQSADTPPRPNYYAMHFCVGKIIQLHAEPEASEADQVLSGSLGDLYGASWGESKREDVQELMGELFEKFLDEYYYGRVDGTFYDFIQATAGLTEEEATYLVNTYSS